MASLSPRVEYCKSWKYPDLSQICKKSVILAKLESAIYKIFDKLEIWLHKADFNHISFVSHTKKRRLNQDAKFYFVNQKII